MLIKMFISECAFCIKYDYRLLLGRQFQTIIMDIESLNWFEIKQEFNEKLLNFLLRKKVNEFYTRGNFFFKLCSYAKG